MSFFGFFGVIIFGGGLIFFGFVYDSIIFFLSFDFDFDWYDMFYGLSLKDYFDFFFIGFFVEYFQVVLFMFLFVVVKEVDDVVCVEYLDFKDFWWNEFFELVEIVVLKQVERNECFVIVVYKRFEQVVDNVLKCVCDL